MNHAAGITLVEILVAMLIVLVVTSGALALIARGLSAQRSAESLARIEESLDAAFVILADEVRAAGYLGLAPPASAVAGATSVGAAELAGLAVAGSCGSSLAHDVAVPVSGADGAWLAAPGVPIACRPSPNGRQRPGSDALILRSARAESSRPAAGRLQVESNLRAAALRADGIARLGTGSRWHDLEVGVYYISADSTGRSGFPSLRRKRLVGGARPAFQDEELVSGVSDLQIAFGVDDMADPDVIVDRWIAPGNPADDGRLRAVRIELEAVTDIDDVSLPARARSKRVTRIVEMRNGGAAG